MLLKVLLGANDELPKQRLQQQHEQQATAEEKEERSPRIHVTILDETPTVELWDDRMLGNL